MGAREGGRGQRASRDGVSLRLADDVGSAVITAGGGQRLAGILNENNYLIGNGGDNSRAYALVSGQ